MIMVCLAPLYSCAGKGYLAQPVAATPFGISSSSLAAAMFGGWTAIWGGVIPGFFSALFLGWCGVVRRGGVDIYLYIYIYSFFSRLSSVFFQATVSVERGSQGRGWGYVL